MHHIHRIQCACAEFNQWLTSRERGFSHPNASRHAQDFTTHTLRLGTDNTSVLFWLLHGSDRLLPSLSWWISSAGIIRFFSTSWTVVLVILMVYGLWFSCFGLWVFLYWFLLSPLPCLQSTSSPVLWKGPWASSEGALTVEANFLPPMVTRCVFCIWKRSTKWTRALTALGFFNQVRKNRQAQLKVAFVTKALISLMAASVPIQAPQIQPQNQAWLQKSTIPQNWLAWISKRWAQLLLFAQNAQLESAKGPIVPTLPWHSPSWTPHHTT